MLDLCSRVSVTATGNGTTTAFFACPVFSTAMSQRNERLSHAPLTHEILQDQYHLRSSCLKFTILQIKVLKISSLIQI